MAGSRIAWRLGIALATAMLAVFALNELVTAHETGAPREVAAVPEPTPSALVQLGFPLAPIAGSILLVARADAVPGDVAPLLQLLDDGTLVVRRHAAAPQGPLVPSRPSRIGIGAAVVVPRGLLGRGGAAARGALLEVVGAWLPERPLARHRLQAVDLGLPMAELERLWGWLP